MNKLIFIAPVLLLLCLALFACGDNSGEELTTTPATYTSPSGVQMSTIPGGTFNMGHSRYANPVHSVTLTPFDISKYEVTYSLWLNVKDWAEQNGYIFNNPGDMGSEKYEGTQDDSHPVTYIEWYDAVLWCNALSEMEGRTPCYYTSEDKSMVYRSDRIDIQNDWVDWTADGYRLPTQAEWEYACRAKTTTDYSFGNNITGSDTNYNDSGDSNDNGTTPVGSYAPNPWGLHDMHGNVAEWCWDWSDLSYYSESPSNNPRGPITGHSRIICGGSWSDDPHMSAFMQSAFSISHKPDFSNILFGFRPVISQ